MSERFYYHGVPVDDLDIDQTLGLVFPKLGRCDGDQVVTLTPKMFLQARKDVGFLDVLNQAFLVVPESTAIQWSSRITGRRLNRVPGAELAMRTIDYCVEKEKRILLVGGLPDSREKAIRAINARGANKVADQVEGDYTFSNETDSRYVAGEVDKRSPGFVLIAGNQVESECWINRWLVREGIQLGVVGNFGQTMDVIAGVKPNYAAARRWGMEWLLRIAMSGDARSMVDRLVTLVNFGTVVCGDYLRRG